MNYLPLVEEFYTIQGEGYHTGKAAYFIRLGGCDIACSWCDSKLSWNSNMFPMVHVDEIIKNAIKYPAKAVVVTGGEPLSWNLDYLCNELKKREIQTFIETSGAYALSGNWDWICLSPKKQNPPKEEIFFVADELKVIIYTEEDFCWAEENASRVSESCKLFLQPEWSRYKTLIPLIVEYIKANPKWMV
jgi:7-carboxy-7-deazaguanine synthase